MYSLYFIAKNNLKKKKSDVAVLTGMIMLAALLLYVGISVLTNMESVVNTAYDMNRSADWYWMNSEGSAMEGIEEILENRSEVVDFEKTPVYFIPKAKFSFFSQKAENDYSFMLASIEEERRICQVYPDHGGVLTDDEILLPFYMKNAFRCKEGDEFTLIVNDQSYEFKVGGFIEDPLFASPLNVPIYKCYITKERADRMAKEEPGLYAYAECKAKLVKDVVEDKFFMEISEEINEKIPEAEKNINYAFMWSSMSNGLTMAAGIGMSVVLVFAVIIIGITLVVTKFSIGNFCEMNIKNIGILQALGYRAVQLTGSFVVEMFLVSLAGSFLGLLAGALSGRFMGNLMASLIGLSWNQGFDFKSAAIVLIVCVAVTMSVAFISSRRCVETPILDALRKGIANHNFHKNYFPLESSRQPLAMNLGLKSIFSTKMKNLGILSMVAILSFVCCIGFGMYQNFAMDINNLVKMVGLEMGDVSYVAEAGSGEENLEAFGKRVEGCEGVEKVLYEASGNIKVSYEDKEISVTCDFWDDPGLLENEIMLTGRMPEFDNEIMLSVVVCEQLGVEVGDIVYVKGNGEEKDYIISGIDQKMNNLGWKATMISEGGERLNGSLEYKQICVYAKEGISGDRLMELLKERFPEREALNSSKMTEESLKPIVIVMKLLCIIFVGVTVFVVALIVFLSLKTRVIREKRNYGVYKALGFTTGWLCIQTVLSNLPTIFAGALAGIVLYDLAGEEAASLCMRTCGIYQCHIQVGAVWKLLTVVFIMVTALAAAFFTSARIRKIQPVKMLAEE